MDVQDIEKYCLEYYNRMPKDMDQATARPEINLQQIKIKVVEGSIKWKNTSPVTDQEGPRRRVNVHNNTGSADVFGNLQTSKESEIRTEVSLSTGAVKGLNKKMALPLPAELKPILGNSVEIDPGNPASISTDKLTLSMTSGHDIPPSKPAATATVTCKTGEFEGNFECKVSLKGPVMFRRAGGNKAVDQVNIETILHGVNGFDVQNGQVTWDMKGHCHFLFDFEQTIEWN